jgi:hypothetical protein
MGGFFRKIHLLVHFGNAFCGRETIIGFFGWLKMHNNLLSKIIVLIANNGGNSLLSKIIVLIANNGGNSLLSKLFMFIVCNKIEYIQEESKKRLLLENEIIILKY